MWNEVEDESCDIVPMPALRLQTRSLGLCCLYSPGFAAEYGTPNGSETWEKSRGIFFFSIGVAVYIHMAKSSTLYSCEIYNFSILHVSQPDIKL